MDDAGTPIDPGAAGAGVRGMMAQFLDRGFIDELRASFRGREGNRCSAIKFTGNALGRIQGETSEAPHAGPAEQPSAAGVASHPASGELEYRPMRPEDAFEVARCFYRAYGLSAPTADEVIYHPERCADRVRAGLHLATVAADPSGRIVGHTALERESTEDPIGMGGYLVVDPDYRGHGIAERLTEIRLKEGREMGLRGMLAMAVTLHTASQKT
ncbi:MAG TPA: GNAT family N-acetyltransferase, partial [Candidatus Binatus sp.]|nr:GNAT family N-acetyltransferase [Candidatus Binatus sp.]